MTPAGERLLNRLAPEAKPDAEELIRRAATRRREGLALDIEAIEADVVEHERERIRRGVVVSLSTMPIFAHVDAYGLGQVLKGEPWPEGR